MEKTLHLNSTLQTLIVYVVLLAFVATTALPLPVTAEEGTSTETESSETEVVEVVEEEPEAEEVVEETEEAEAETTEEASSESSSSESTSSSEESSSSEEASSSESSESEESSSTSSESTYEESAAETEVTETAEETTTEVTTTAPDTDEELVEETATESTTGTDATASSTSSTAAVTEAQASTTPDVAEDNNPSAGSSLATTTDTTASSTPETSVTTVTDGDTSVGTTTTTTVPPTETSTSTASSTPEATNASSTIDTGAAIATANILNVVNTNLTNADGSIVFVDTTGDVNETLDLRSSFGGGGGGGGSAACSLSGCKAYTTNINLDSDAEIDNALVVEADTGNNLIEDTGTGEITTGNAYANANIVNVANANIIDSQYLLFTLNAFGDFNGDLVLPGLLPFVQTAATTPSISTEDTAIIVNEIVTSAVTGENTAEASASSVSTGDATTGLSLYNNINTTLANDNVSVLFRVHGDWNGVVFGLPETVSWHETQQGYLLDINDLNGSSSVASAGVGSVAATNTAVINNRISVAANTGGNEVLGADEALISTGNAYAGVNVVNVANANIVGQNWMLAIVNVFGDFNGNVSFGRPDIWVGGTANVPKSVQKGSEVTYTYTVQNNGDAPASDITVTDAVSPFVSPTDIGEAGEHASGTKQITWHVQDLAPGESTTVSYTAKVNTSGFNQAITNTISAELTEDDDDYDNNTEVLTFFTRKHSGGGSSVSFSGNVYDDDDDESEEVDEDGDSENYGPIESLQMQRQPFLSTVTSESPDAHQTITIYNNTNLTVPNVIFTDQLYDINNRLVREEHWELGDVLPHEQITLEYTLSFNHAATPPLQTYSFDSVFQNKTNYNVISVNGHINHLAVVSDVITQSTDDNVSYNGNYDITSDTADLARVLGATTSTSTAVEASEDDIPLVPVISSTRGGSSDGTTPVNLYYLLLIILFFLLLAVYVYLERRKLAPKLVPVFARVQQGWSFLLCLLPTILR